MGIVAGIIFGAIVGWMGFRLAGDSHGQGCLTNIVIGIGGGMLGGAALSLITGTDYLFPTGFTRILLSFVASAIGAAALILGLRALARRT